MGANRTQQKPMQNCFKMSGKPAGTIRNQWKNNRIYLCSSGGFLRGYSFLRLVHSTHGWLWFLWFSGQMGNDGRKSGDGATGVPYCCSWMRFLHLKIFNCLTIWMKVVQLNTFFMIDLHPVLDGSGDMLVLTNVVLLLSLWSCTQVQYFNSGRAHEAHSDGRVHGDVCLNRMCWMLGWLQKYHLGQVAWIPSPPTPHSYHGQVSQHNGSMCYFLGYSYRIISIILGNWQNLLHHLMFTMFTTPFHILFYFNTF